MSAMPYIIIKIKKMNVYINTKQKLYARKAYLTIQRLTTLTSNYYTGQSILNFSITKQTSTGTYVWIKMTLTSK